MTCDTIRVGSLASYYCIHIYGTFAQYDMDVTLCDTCGSSNALDDAALHPSLSLVVHGTVIHADDRKRNFHRRIRRACALQLQWQRRRRCRGWGLRRHRRRQCRSWSWLERGHEGQLMRWKRCRLRCRSKRRQCCRNTRQRGWTLCCIGRR